MLVFLKNRVLRFFTRKPVVCGYLASLKAREDAIARKNARETRKKDLFSALQRAYRYVFPVLVTVGVTVFFVYWGAIRPLMEDKKELLFLLSDKNSFVRAQTFPGTSQK